MRSYKVIIENKNYKYFGFKYLYLFLINVCYLARKKMSPKNCQRNQVKLLPYSFDIQNSENKKLICIIDMPGPVGPDFKLKLPFLNNKTCR